MRREAGIAVLSALALAAVAAGADPCAIPQDVARTRPDAGGAPVEVAVGVYLVDVLEIDDVRESFRVDVVLVLRWRDPRLAAQARGASLEGCRLTLDDVWHPRLQPINEGDRRELLRDLRVSADGEVRFRARAVSELSAELDLHEFPWDEQRLALRLASLDYGGDDVVFRVDEERTGRLPKIAPAGWDVVANTSDPGVAPLSAAGQDRERLDHVVVVRRQVGYYFWNFVPLGFIVLMAWSVFWLDPNVSASQLSIATASIFSLIAFLLGLRQLLPRVGYLTQADKLVLAATVLVFLAFGEVVLTNRLTHQGRGELALRVDWHARWIYLVLAGLIMAGIVIG